jgi:hypothetical protein
MSERAGLDVKIVEAHGFCPETWPHVTGGWFTHECGRGKGHGGRHTCEHSGCLSWRPVTEGGDDE